MGQDGVEHVHLDMMTESVFKSVPAINSEWLEAVPMAFTVHDKLSQLKIKLGNLFVEAAQEGDLYILKHLFQNHKVSVDMDHKSRAGLTALHSALR